MPLHVAAATLRFPLTIAAALCLTWSPSHAADKPEPSAAYLEFVRGQASDLRAGDNAPATLDQWESQRKALRQSLIKALGGLPSDPCPLAPKVLGAIDRDGYRVERVVFQTRPGVFMTANAYVPTAPGKHPAILQVHGHWKGAKQDPVVQARCIGAAKLGFFVLAVDAFGAGERGVGKALGEYHGGLAGATLLPVGLPLSGLQVVENMRAVDYLLTRPEVDGRWIGITGASGGGNQTMYSGALDVRLKAVVPVCSVGNYGAYLGAACCLCEVVPGALRFADEWGVLGLTAPRALMVGSATQDAPQFSVAEAEKSLALTRPIYSLFTKPENLRHTLFVSKHDYNRAMREAMYGWMTLHLKSEGDGSPIPEPGFKTDDPEALRCYPGDTRPDDWMTLPRFAAIEARKLLAAKAVPDDPDAWRADAERRRTALVETVFGGFPDLPPARAGDLLGSGVALRTTFEVEPGLSLSLDLILNYQNRTGRPPGLGKKAPLAVVIDFDAGEDGDRDRLTRELSRSGWSYAHVELRTTGLLAGPRDKAAGIADHNPAEWGLWIGRPLLGQWVYDVRRVLDCVESVYGGTLPPEVCVIGKGRGGLVALGAGAIDRRITQVVAVNSLASYVTEVPYAGQALGVIAPGILRAVGDVAHLAALNAPKRVVIAGGVSGDGHPLSAGQLNDAYKEASKAWKLLNAGGEFSALGTTDPAQIAAALR